MKKAQLIFIPSPGISHLVSTVETAKHLLDRDERISILILIMKLTKNDVFDKYITKMSSDSTQHERLRFTNLPEPELSDSDSQGAFRLFELIDSQIVHVREIVRNLIEHSSSPVAGLVLDMFCTKFIDAADEFHLPSYVYYTSGACALSVTNHLYLLTSEHNQDLSRYKDSDEEISFSCLSDPVPGRVLPGVFVTDGEKAKNFFNCFKRFVETKGIMVNTFYELETRAIESLTDSKHPKIYPVGPILNSSDQSGCKKGDEIMDWLDKQLDSSVVFLCFGTMGSFMASQVREIAVALERSGHRFLWALRKPGSKGSAPFPVEYEDFGEVLPEGFLERTEGIGKVIGWAPQVEVLSHTAVGGFVSHCGWNSTLESLWYGVPMATFPLYAEQQLNAFQLVMELKLAEKIRLDYQKNFAAESDEDQEIVGAEEIEAAIRRLMEENGGVRQRVKEMQKKGREALSEGGSSFAAMNQFIDDVIKNMVH